MSRVWTWRIIGLYVVLIGMQALGSEQLPGRDKGGYVTVDYLAWKVQEDQLQYAIAFPNGFPNTTVSSVDFSGIIIEPCFRLHSGFRLELGYLFHSDWDIWASWTRFHQLLCDSTTTDMPQQILVTTINPVSSEFNEPWVADSASSTFKLHFDTASINIGRYFTPWDCIALETFMGIQGARIRQTQVITYDNAGVTDFDTTYPTLPVNRSNNFSGVGPSIGAQCTWHLGSSDFSFFSAISGSLIVGKFCTSVSQSFANPITPFDSAEVSVLGMPREFLMPPLSSESITFNQKKFRVRPMADLQVGAGWEHEFGCHFGLQVRVAFEAQIWPNQWQCTPSIVSVTTGNLPGGGDLTFYGATVGAGLLF